MSHRIRILALTILVAFGYLSLSSAQDEATQDPAKKPIVENPILDMDWLAGTWSGDMWGGTFEAHYSTADGGRILSHSRLWRNKKESFFEFEVFEQRDGVVHLQPYPGGKRATGLTLVTHDAEARKAIFENENKDYPTRITYHRVGKEHLTITLSDPHGQSGKTESFELRR